MKFRIFRQSKSAMQSGKKNAKKWIAELLEEKNPRSINPLMGWVSSDETKSQLRFEFFDKESAINFLKENYQVSENDLEIIEPKESSVKIKSYSENFTSGA